MFCRREEGGGRGSHKNGINFSTSIFDIAMINAILLLQSAHDHDDDFVIPALCLAKEGGTKGQCFTLLYGAPRSHLTSPHCGSSSVEISDRGQ